MPTARGTLRGLTLEPVVAQRPPAGHWTLGQRCHGDALGWSAGDHWTLVQCMPDGFWAMIAAREWPDHVTVSPCQAISE
jgi:hypothetical protein